MRIGVIILPDRPWSEAKQFWVRAEEYGFDHLWTYDHLGWRNLIDGPWFDAVATLTAAAHVTSRVHLGTMVASPNFRYPVHFAREVTTLDDISGGRAMIGLGAGGLGFDAQVLGGPQLSARQQVDRFAEFVELFDLLLRHGRATWSGDYYRAVDARCEQSRLPLVLAANGPRSMRIAERFGQGWVTSGSMSDTDEAWWRSVEKVSRLNRTTKRRFLVLDSRTPTYSLSSVACFSEVVARAEALGFTDIITHWPRESGWYAGKESVLETIARELFTFESGSITVR